MTRFMITLDTDGGTHYLTKTVTETVYPPLGSSLEIPQTLLSRVTYLSTELGCAGLTVIVQGGVVRVDGNGNTTLARAVGHGWTTKK